MPSVTLKNIPPKTLAKLKQMAAENHRSLQGQLMTLVDQALEPTGSAKTIEEVYQRIKALGVSSPSESVQMIREDRDAR